MVYPGTLFIRDNGAFLCIPMKMGVKCEQGGHLGEQQRIEEDVAELVLQPPARRLCLYTKARCYSSLKLLVTMGILHIKEPGEGQ